MINVGLFGVGFIGKVHAENIINHPNAALTTLYDPYADEIDEIAGKAGAHIAETIDEVFASDVDAVLIASSTDTHAELLLRSARAGIPVLCEKPVHLDLDTVINTVRESLTTGTPTAIGFNRRFDRDHSMLKQKISQGVIGHLELLHLTSRGPIPPPISYIKISGGQFRDQTIHFFDLACWIAEERPDEVFAYGSCLIDPAIGEAGDIDTSVVLLKMPSGAIVTIDNNRRTVYGYDENIEAFGSAGMVISGRQPENYLSIYNAEGQHRAGLHQSWFERMKLTYITELDVFITGVSSGQLENPSLLDAVQAQLIAEAAARSMAEGRSIRVEWALLDKLEEIR